MPPTLAVCTTVPGIIDRESEGRDSGRRDRARIPQVKSTYVGVCGLGGGGVVHSSTLLVSLLAVLDITLVTSRICDLVGIAENMRRCFFQNVTIRVRIERFRFLFFCQLGDRCKMIFGGEYCWFVLCTVLYFTFKRT